MEKNLIQIYSIEVIQGYTSANVDRLSQVILQNASQRLGDNPSHTRFEDSYCPDSAIIDRIVEDMQEVYSEFQSKSSSLSFPKKGRLSLIGKWGHIHEKNMSTNTHDHKPVDVSAVTYLKVSKESGQLKFNPNPLHDYSYTIPPEKGMFLLFPGWLPHSVNRNLTNEPRISVSFNFKLEEA